MAAFPKPLAAALLATVAVALGAAPASNSNPPRGARCDVETSLTLVGLDTASATALFALPDPASGAAWLELRFRERTAVAYAAGSPVVQGTSSGSGPIFSVLSCGNNCLQPARFSAGRFEPLGEALLVPASATVSATYDGGGTPWIVLHEPSGIGVLEVRAFRLVGREWTPRGTLRVTDVGHSGAHAVPGDKESITAGTGLFSPTAEPRYWLDGLPDITPARRGEVVPLGSEYAAYIAADGTVFRTGDRGATWRRSIWTPWSATVVQPWKRGEDYDAEPPNGSLQLPLPLVWFDHRDPKAPSRAVLTEMDSDGAWRQLAALPALLSVAGADSVELTEVIRFDDGTWLLFGGCVAHGNESRIVLQIWRPGAVPQPLELPLLPPLR